MYVYYKQNHTKQKHHLNSPEKYSRYFMLLFRSIYPNIYCMKKTDLARAPNWRGSQPPPPPGVLERGFNDAALS